MDWCACWRWRCWWCWSCTRSESTRRSGGATAAASTPRPHDPTPKGPHGRRLGRTTPRVPTIRSIPSPPCSIPCSPNPRAAPRYGGCACHSASHLCLHATRRVCRLCARIRWPRGCVRTADVASTSSRCQTTSIVCKKPYSITDFIYGVDHKPSTLNPEP
jgi:hypothetical protein